MTFWTFILAYIIGYTLTETTKAGIIFIIKYYRTKKALKIIGKWAEELKISMNSESKNSLH